MDVRDGFIEGIYNYCDAWCQRCALTTYCRLFADSAEMDAMLDPGLRMVAEAPPLPEEVAPPPPRWLQELIDECNQAAREPAREVVDGEAATGTRQLARRLRQEHQSIQARAREYAFSVHGWLRQQEAEVDAEPLGPAAVISWFHIMVATKVYRALAGLAGCEHLDVESHDHVGSAKVALLGIDESHAAFLMLVERGRVPHAGVAAFIGDLVWLGESLERVFPTARAFVRPGLDEPEAVARLRAET